MPECDGRANGHVKTCPDMQIIGGNRRPKNSDPEIGPTTCLLWADGVRQCTHRRSLRQFQRPQTLPLSSPESLQSLVWKFSLISFLSAWMVFAPRISLSDFFLTFSAMSVMRVEAVWRPLASRLFLILYFKVADIIRVQLPDEPVEPQSLLNMCLTFAAMQYFKMLYYIFPFVLFASPLTSLWLSGKYFQRQTAEFSTDSLFWLMPCEPDIYRKRKRTRRHTLYNKTQGKKGS